jgi:hypothetical protein
MNGKTGAQMDKNNFDECRLYDEDGDEVDSPDGKDYICDDPRSTAKADREIELEERLKSLRGGINHSEVRMGLCPTRLGRNARELKMKEIWRQWTS